MKRIDVVAIFFEIILDVTFIFNTALDIE